MLGFGVEIAAGGLQVLGGLLAARVFLLECSLT